MRPTFRLVPDFIIPHLNNSTYGGHLLWEDKKQGSFKISRIHQSSEMWNEQCIEVYKVHIFFFFEKTHIKNYGAFC